MPLPKVNTPTYELVLPSSGRKIRYRPFLVREEKILIMALESEDVKQITEAVMEILESCILTKGFKLDNLATFDLEYLFLNVRSKSVGETVEINVTCPDDNKTTVSMSIDLDSIKVVKGQGFPLKNSMRVGDLIIKFEVVFPDTIDPKKQQLIHKLLPKRNSLKTLFL